MLGGPAHGPRVHGGPDASGPAAHDFSANANACGPCPAAVAAVRQADPVHYPDPAYVQLRAALAQLHGVAAARIVMAASASEFIMRISTAVARPGGTVLVPEHAYGDYAWAARAQGLVTVHAPCDTLCLAWACDPSSPLGQTPAALAQQLQDLAGRVPLVLDCAYAPLRLQGTPALPPAQRAQAWQLWSPNKAMGLTGVRGAYAIAPADADPALLQRLEVLAPSWPVGAHGVALLQAWTGAPAQRWLQDCLPVLRAWKARQTALCTSLGWRVRASDAHFFCAQPGPAERLPAWLAQLRAQGVQLRDCASFGLPGHVRLAVLPPAQQDALAAAWARVRSAGTHNHNEEPA